MEALAVYIFGAIIGTSQLALGAYVWHSQRERTKAEATQITANSFDTMVGTVTNLTAKLSDTLMKSIDGINSREEKIDKLGEEIRQLRNDNDDLREQLNDSINANVQRDNKSELQQKSINDLADANDKQATELIEVKVEMYTLRTELKKKDEVLLEKDKQILRQDERIKMLEARVDHLERENAELKKPVPPAEEKVVEVKAVETKTEGVNPS